MGKKTEIFGVWMLACIGFFCPWHAACGEETTPLVQRHSFAVGLGLSHFDNVEPDWGPGLDIEIEGPMYSVMGEYTYHNEIMMSAGIEYSVGHQDYDGSVYELFTDGIRYTPAETDVDGETVECRVLIGYDFMFLGNHLGTLRDVL